MYITCISTKITGSYDYFTVSFTLHKCAITHFADFPFSTITTLTFLGFPSGCLYMNVAAYTVATARKVLTTQT